MRSTFRKTRPVVRLKEKANKLRPTWNDGSRAHRKCASRRYMLICFFKCSDQKSSYHFITLCCLCTSIATGSVLLGTRTSVDMQGANKPTAKSSVRPLTIRHAAAAPGAAENQHPGLEIAQRVAARRSTQGLRLGNGPLSRVAAGGSWAPQPGVRGSRAAAANTSAPPSLRGSHQPSSRSSSGGGSSSGGMGCGSGSSSSGGSSGGGSGSSSSAMAQRGAGSGSSGGANGPGSKRKRSKARGYGGAPSAAPSMLRLPRGVSATVKEDEPLDEEAFALTSFVEDEFTAEQIWARHGGLIGSSVPEEDEGEEEDDEEVGSAPSPPTTYMATRSATASRGRSARAAETVAKTEAAVEAALRARAEARRRARVAAAGGLNAASPTSPPEHAHTPALWPAASAAPRTALGASGASSQSSFLHYAHASAAADPLGRWPRQHASQPPLQTQQQQQQQQQLQQLRQRSPHAGAPNAPKGPRQSSFDIALVSPPTPKPDQDGLCRGSAGGAAYASGDPSRPFSRSANHDAPGVVVTVPPSSAAVAAYIAAAAAGRAAHAAALSSPDVSFRSTASADKSYRSTASATSVASSSSISASASDRQRASSDRQRAEQQRAGGTTPLSPLSPSAAARAARSPLYLQGEGAPRPPSPLCLPGGAAASEGAAGGVPPLAGAGAAPLSPPPPSGGYAAALAAAACLGNGGSAVAAIAAADAAIAAAQKAAAALRQDHLRAYESQRNALTSAIHGKVQQAASTATAAAARGYKLREALPRAAAVVEAAAEAKSASSHQ